MLFVNAFLTHLSTLELYVKWDKKSKLLFF